MINKYNEGQAELKDCKLRETLTSNVDGNPEPSPEDREGAETRHRLCVRCGEHIPSSRYKSAIYCNDICRQRTLQDRYRHKRGVKVGIGSGGNQWGKDNHQYKNGIGKFRVLALSNLPHICNRCKSIKTLLVHHKDEDRTNNILDNLEILCKECHQDHHCLRDKTTGRFIKHA